MRPAVASAELTTLHVVNQMMSLMQLLPLPLHLADQMACTALDKLEHLALYKQGILDRLHQLAPDRLKSAPLTDEEKSFYFDLLEFVSSTKAMMASGLKNNLTFFIETELALLEGVEGVLRNLHSTHVGMRLDSSLDGDFAGQIQNLKQVFEHAIHEQKEIVSWALGETVDHNPLEPVWKHLQSAAQKLTPSEDTIKSLQDKVTLFKEILKGAIEHIKMAAKDPEQLFVDVKATIFGNAINIARAFLPHFAISGIQRLTGFSFETSPSKDVSTLWNSNSGSSSSKSSAAAFEIQDTPHEDSTKKGGSVEKKSVTIAEAVEIIGSDVEESWSGEVKEATDDTHDLYEDAETENCGCSSQPPANVERGHESELVEEDGDGEEGNDESAHMDNANVSN